MEDKKGRRGRPKNDAQDDSNSHCELLGESASDLLDFSRMIEEHPDSPSSSASRHSSLSKPCELSRSSPYLFAASPLRTPIAARTTRTTNTRPCIEDELSVLPMEGKCSPPKSNQRSALQAPDDALLSPSLYPRKMGNKHHLAAHLRKPNPPLLKVPPTMNSHNFQKLPLCTDAISSRPHESSSSRMFDCPRTVPVPQHVIRSSRSIIRMDEDGGARRKPPAVAAVREQKPHHTYNNRNNSRWARTMVQVMPGVEMPLIGTEESVEAIARQDIQETVCQACQLELYCINSASMVLCPLCRSFSAIEDVSSSRSSSSRSSDLNASLGLGMTLELLAEELERLET